MSAFVLSSYSNIVCDIIGQNVDMHSLPRLMHMSRVLIVTGMQKTLQPSCSHPTVTWCIRTLVKAVQPQLARNAQGCVDMQGSSRLMHMSSVLITTAMHKPHWDFSVILQ